MDSTFIDGDLPIGMSRVPTTTTLVNTDSSPQTPQQQIVKFPSFEDIKPVLTTALLITGNTIGAGTLVIPEVAAKPGMAPTVAIFAVAYLSNLISGLVLADVAIKQNESSGGDVPSSFKEFAEVNLESEVAATGISGISLFTNFCILSFGFAKAGSVVGNVAHTDPFTMSLGLAAVLGTLAKTQTSQKLSEFSSLVVTVLFASFAGLLIPGLAAVQDPLATLLAPGTELDLPAAASAAFPIVMTTLVFSNIVPSVAKILDYDRTKTTAAIILGSLIPLSLYLAWCFACLGGGIAIGSASPLVTTFSVAAATGSCLGCVMSISEELDSFWQPNTDVDSKYSLPAVCTAISIPVMASFLLSSGYGDFSIPLKLAGSYGSPMLYGAIPAAMAWTQREKLLSNTSDKLEDVMPGGFVTLGLLGAAATSLMVHELSLDFSGLL